MIFHLEMCCGKSVGKKALRLALLPALFCIACHKRGVSVTFLQDELLLVVAGFTGTYNMHTNEETSMFYNRVPAFITSLASTGFSEIFTKYFSVIFWSSNFDPSVTPLFTVAKHACTLSSSVVS